MNYHLIEDLYFKPHHILTLYGLNALDPGIIDESIRHAITKFSHLHFPATKESAKRIERLGERKKNIFKFE